MSKDLQPGQHQGNRAAEKNAERTKRSEEMERTGHVLQQKADGQKVEKDAHSARNPIVGFSPLPVHILNRNFTNTGAIPGSQRRDKTMHLTIQRDVVDHLTAISLERGAKIVNVDAGKFSHKPVGAT